MKPIVRAYYISQHDDQQDVATTPVLWFVVPTTESGRWDLAVAAWIKLVGRHPSGFEKFTVFAVNVPAPPPLYLTGPFPKEQWGFVGSQAQLAPAPAAAPVTFWRAYYISRFIVNPDKTSDDAYVTVGTSVWFVVPQIQGPQTDARIRDTPDARTHPDGSFEHVYAITTNALPVPEPNTDATRPPGPFGSYREWSSVRNDEPFVMPGVN